MKGPLFEVTVRDEDEGDRAAVFAVHAEAFPSDAEGRLVDALRNQARPLVSLVAEAGGAVVGHVLFSPVHVEGQGVGLVWGLAPVGVRPTFQGRGIGRRLIEAGLARCRAARGVGVVLLGSPARYGRFGFVPASSFGLRCLYDAPAEAFQALELVPGALAGATGTVRYHPAFDALG